MEENPDLSALDIPDDVPGEEAAAPASTAYNTEPWKQSLQSAREHYRDKNRTYALRGARGQQIEHVIQAAKERLEYTAALGTKREAAAREKYEALFTPAVAQESSPNDNLALAEEAFDPSGQYGSRRKSEAAETIPVPDDLVLPETLDPSGQYGSKKQPIASPPIPAPGLVLPDTFDPSGQYGSKQRKEEETIPVEEEESETAPLPIDFISDGITGKGGKGAKGGGGSGGKSSPNIKSPPIASQVPPEIPEAELAPASAAMKLGGGALAGAAGGLHGGIAEGAASGAVGGFLIGGPAGAAVGAAAGLATGALHDMRQAPGSVRDFLPGEGTRSADSGSSMAAMAAVISSLNKIAGARSRI